MSDEVKVNSEEIPDPIRDSKGRFLKGCQVPGSGKPIATKASALRQAIYSRADELIATSIQSALDGDSAMLQFLVGRVVPPLKPQSMPLNIDLSGVSSLSDLGNRLIMACCDDSNGSQDAALSVLTALGHLARIEESTELRARIDELEKRLNS